MTSPQDRQTYVSNSSSGSHELLGNKWQLLDTIGNGSFGNVCKAKNVTSGRTVALKIIPVATNLVTKSQVGCTTFIYIHTFFFANVI